MHFPEKTSPAGTLLAERCAARGVRMRVYFVEETGSTNTDVAKMLAEERSACAGFSAECPPRERSAFALFAARQTAGRGRAGRSWASEDSGNIYLSCGFRPQIAPARMANFTLWMGVALARVLREKYGVPAQVKWPNDIFCSGKKLAGILTDVHVDSSRVRGIILGIGLNVNRDPATLPPAVRALATSLRCELASAAAGTGDAFRAAPLDVASVCAEILLGVENAYEKFLAGTHTGELSALWRDYDFLAGEPVCAVYGGNEEISGTACGIDVERGCILIREKNGELRAFSAGDVSLKKGG